MATMQILTLSSSIASIPKHHNNLPVSIPGVHCKSIHSSFSGLHLKLLPLRRAQIEGRSIASRSIVMMVKPAIQFIQGTDERTIPDVKLTKSRDGT
ncbi:hypothetical protein J5N97_024299 [Dioscorea zingiberensis]|uniref:Uncharacterized protein n=1 Tax=Dioscorea zingiberensis TaxID=325984 RepID=A0A9D5H8T6_9LILI|nr:hypothetical protein J5N97_024299 [Dioscorea zingiberensis]